MLLSKLPPPNWVQYLSTNLSLDLYHSHSLFFLHTSWLFNRPPSTSLLMFFLSSTYFSGLLVVPKGMTKNVQGHKKWKMITHFSKWERKKKSKEGRREGRKEGWKGWREKEDGSFGKWRKLSLQYAETWLVFSLFSENVLNKKRMFSQYSIFFWQRNVALEMWSKQLVRHSLGINIHSILPCAVA